MPNFFFISSLPVFHNAIKNILFKGATAVLNFVVGRLFALAAFKMRDYTSFLMFAEDIKQKALFARSRGFNRQTLLVGMYAALTAVAGFYDTLLWGLDFPGYITKSTRVDASRLAPQMLDSPGYVTLLSHPTHNLSSININETIGANLYQPGLNFTLPGINLLRFPEVVPPPVPLSTSVPPNIWLDSEGFAVGPDNYVMFAPDMNTPATFCAANTIGPDQQAWGCKVRNTDALTLVDKAVGRPQIWWDLNTSEYLSPSRNDNPWDSLGTGGNTAVMKQVFTVTKGTRRHTFLHTTVKATMISYEPFLFDDAEITDFIHRMWQSPNQTISHPVQTMADTIIGAKNNRTSLTMGSFFKVGNASVSTMSNDYLNVINPIDGSSFYAALRSFSSTIQLLRSEVISHPPTPFYVCARPYSNYATGGVVRKSSCYSTLTANATQSRFLGQIDTSSVIIVNGILGDGTQNTSVSGLDPDGVAWYSQNTGHIDKLLVSRALILGGIRSDVSVDLQQNVAALSYLQLLLVLVPIVLAGGTWAITSRQPMSFFKNSFLAAVCVTTHLKAGINCKKVDYLRFPPEISLTVTHDHVKLGTGNGTVIARVDEGQQSGCGSVGYATDPLLLDSEAGQSSTGSLVLLQTLYMKT